MVLPLPPVEDRALTSEERTATLDRIAELLELTYRADAHGGRPDLIDDLVHLLLTRETAGHRSRGTYRTLLMRWASWDGVRLADPATLTAALKQDGVPAQRARHLLDLLQVINDECHARGRTGTSLAWLSALDDAEAAQLLGRLPRVSETEARRIIRNSRLGLDFESDPMVKRVLQRMGLRGERGSPVPAAEPDLPRNLDTEVLRLNLAHHGRSTCLAKEPRCVACPLISFCATGRGAAPDSEKPVAVELFAGGGGLGEGFGRAGFDVAMAVEIDRDAAQTYRLNHPGTVVLEADATTISGVDLTGLVPRVADATALMAGPPCQGYSVAGHRKADDKRNNLYTAVVDIAADLNPRFVVIENVPGMRRVGGESYVSAVLEALSDVGYNAEEHLLRACDYGVPQLRRRMIFLAQLKEYGAAPSAPRPTSCAGTQCPRCRKSGPGTCGLTKTPTVLETLDGLRPLQPGTDAEYIPPGDGELPMTNASTMAHSQRVLDKIETITAGAGPISYRRLHEDLARTIVAGHRALPVHPTLHRTISVREAARIQGFNDSHVFAGTRSKQPLQVANAVPPALGEALALVLTDQMSTSGATRNSDRAAAAAAGPRSDGPVVASRIAWPELPATNVAGGAGQPKSG